MFVGYSLQTFGLVSCIKQSPFLRNMHSSFSFFLINCRDSPSKELIDKSMSSLS